MTWTLARRTGRMNPSAIREILKLTEQPGVLSLAGGLPSPDSFPVDAVREATARVLRDTPREALQYAASEGYGPLRDWVSARLATDGIVVEPGQVLITTGSQQGLDLVGKLLIDAGSAVAVETPTYLGALQAFAPCEPAFAALASDDEGPKPEALAGDEDRILAIDGVDQEENAAHQREEPERHGHHAAARATVERRKREADRPGERQVDHAIGKDRADRVSQL